MILAGKNVACSYPQISNKYMSYVIHLCNKNMRRNFEKILKSNFSPVDSGNGTHDSDSGDGSDKDFVMDENSVEDSDYSEGEERKKKKNVKTGKNSGKKLKMWQIPTPFKDPKKEAKRQRAIQARKNRERSNLKKESLQEKYDNLQKKYEKMEKENDKLKKNNIVLQTQVNTYETILKITKN